MTTFIQSDVPINPSVSTPRFWSLWLPTITAIAMLVLAAHFQFQHTHSLQVPAEEDLYRDLGSANTFLNGYTSADPQFLGATRWYNPLIPYLIATISRITHLSVLDLYTHGGVFLNLLAPILLLIWVSRIASPWAGCFSLAAYLFMGNHDYPSWKYATYSPWLWPFNFTQGLALATLLTLHVGVDRNKTQPFVWGGLLLGLTFLSHTAPAAIIALTLIAVCGIQLLTRRWTLPHAATRLCAAGMLSMLVAAVLMWPLWQAYHLTMLNVAPANFTGLFKNEVIEINIHWKNLIAIPTLLALLYLGLFKPETRQRTLLFLAFACSSAALFCYGLLVDILRGKGWLNLPLLVPSFHFHLYFLLGLNVAFGIGVNGMIRRTLHSARARALAGITLASLLTAIAWPGYAQNHDTLKFTRDAKELAQKPELKAFYEWCLAATNADDVFLADDYYGHYGTGAAGRKVIVLDPIFTNPYLDFDSLRQDRDTLYAALKSGDQATFNRIADHHRVRYVLTAPDMLFGLYSEQPVDTTPINMPELELIKTVGHLHIYERRIR